MFEDFVERGRSDEEFVARLLVAHKGGSVVVSSLEEDVHDHVDFWWTRPGSEGRIGFDVKGMKNIGRGDSGGNDKSTWIETINVNGYPGWVYGKASYIAFRRTGKVVFVVRESLAKFIETKIKNLPLVLRNPRRCYVPYRRAGRKDLITLVPLDDIEKLADFVISHT